MKASHLKSAGVLKPLSIPMWKWDDIGMDFIVGLPLTARKKDSIWVIVDRLTKTAHFIAVHTTYSVKDAEEKVQVIRENLKMTQMRQKSYHDKGTAPRHFEVGDYVYLKVSPTKGV
jgi:hypothetical protein